MSVMLQDKDGKRKIKKKLYACEKHKHYILNNRTEHTFATANAWLKLSNAKGL